MEDQVEQVVQWLAVARTITVLTGAGVSKESGIPTFRDAMEGLWAEFDPQVLASPEGFRRNPGLVWRWYAARANQAGDVSPNPGHHALARLGELKPVSLITQNVDGLHQRAGSREVLELHGNILRHRCFDQGHPMPIERPWEVEEPPVCPQCGSLARPDVIWFGELLPVDVLERALQASQECHVMLVVGTSGLVQPAASLPHYARETGAHLIEINPDRTPLTRHVDAYLSGPAATVLPHLVAGVEQLLAKQ
ncbi:MAG: NAD-dependent deacylase [Ardenticatenales bacterium]|nr:NAD-dependent deacylase [Ardenticatenales bacterium]